MIYWLVVYVFCFLLVGCGHLFYHPTKIVYLTPDRFNIEYESHNIVTIDGEILQAWWLKTQKVDSCCVVVQFHGNAENMTSHFLSLAWLVSRGIDLVTFDYRGYGDSTGTPKRSGLIEDSRTIIRWVLNHKLRRGRHVFLIGQSLGGAVLVPAVSQVGLNDISGIVLESTFSSYRRVAKDQLSRFWLTWPFQTPLSWLIPSGLDPVDSIGTLKLPKLFLHSRQDPVVAYSFGREMFERAAHPKEFWDVEGEGHVHAFLFDDSPYRERLVAWLHMHSSFR